MRILIVDDQRSARRTLARILERMSDLELHEAESLPEARAMLAQHKIDVALVDIRLSKDSVNREGLTLVGELRSGSATIPIVVSGSSDMAEIRSAMRLGAYDYVLKDELSEELVLPILEGIRGQQRLEREVAELRAARGGDASLGLVGTSSTMCALRELIQRVALSDRPVLVYGPTGSGKELVVRAIHNLGPHPNQPLMALNCGAFPAALIESQLFGHERGAFTGADRRHDGFFTAVGEGTLFLDEIAELPMDLQAKLLRVLETGTFHPIGSTSVHQFRGRAIAATHAELEERIASKSFREDLFYRLNVLEVRVPSLEERRDDIPALIAYFVAKQRRQLRFTAEAIEILQAAQWPGNVRQLRNVVDRLAVFSPDPIVTPTVIGSLPGHRSQDSRATVAELARAVLRLADGDKLELVRQGLIEEAIRLSNGDTTAAARLLGVHPKRLERPAESDDDDDGHVAQIAEDEARRQLVLLLTEHRGNISAVARALGKANVQVRRWLKRYGLNAEDYRASN